MQPMEVTESELTFPTSVERFMPPDLAGLRRDRKVSRSWDKFVGQWFYVGADAKLLIPKPGIDKAVALRHLKYIMHSYEPKHEDKVTAVAYLMGEWFEPLKDDMTKKVG